MDTEQPAADSDVLDRMSNFFSPKPEGPVETQEAAPEEASVEIEDAEPIEAQDEEEAPEPTGEQLEIDGEEYVLPPKLAEKVKEWKEGALRQEDYTRKTQVLAELQRQVSLNAELLNQQQQFNAAVAPQMSELNRIQGELAKYQGIDWGSLDVETYVRYKGTVDSLKERGLQLQSTLSNVYQQFENWKSQKVQERQRIAVETASKMIPKWSEDANQAAMNAALAVNYTPDELKNAEFVDGRFATLAWKAAQFDKLQSDKASTLSKAQKAPPVVKPGPGQGQTAARDREYKDLRQRLRKTGDVRDAARVYLSMKGK